jgi:hypothetical protein
MRIVPASLAIPLLALASCQSSTPLHGVDGSGPNAIVQSDIERRIGELRYLHDQELYDSMLRLVDLSETAAPQIRAGLRSDDWLTRASLAWVMGATGDRRYVPDLRTLLDDSVPGVRYQTAASLVELGDGAGFAALVDGLDAKDLRDRYKCFESLKRATGRDFGYQHDAAPESRRLAVARWRDWLESVKSSAL